MGRFAVADGVIYACLGPVTLPPPPSLPDYDLLRPIGRGSYGDVWLARSVTGQFRAVKIVWRERFDDARPYEREFSGVRQFAPISLSTPLHLALLHVGRSPDGHYFYYVMELADDVRSGREIDPDTYVPSTLRERLRRRDRFTASEVTRLGVELARALHALHTQGLVHRDIKPSNIVIVGGFPKLADIGLVTSFNAENTYVGTEGFVAPEGPGTPRADIYSLGKVLYELATGLDQLEYPRLPPDLVARADRKMLLELNEVIIRASAPAASERFASAQALLDELLLIQAGRSVRRLRTAERRLRRALRTTAVLAVIAIVGTGGAYVERRRANEETTRRLQAEAERDRLARRRSYAGNLASTQRALDNADYGRARRLLAEVSPKTGELDLRGFEWHVLWRAAQGNAQAILVAGGPAITRLALSPDEDHLAAHDDAGTVTLYGTATLREIRRIPGVGAFAGFSDDGAWLVGRRADGLLTRWPLHGGEAQSIASETRMIPLMATGADELMALTESSPHTLRRMRFTTHQAVNAFDLTPSAPPETGLPWTLFRSGTDIAGETLTLACVSGSGSDAQFRLTRIDFGKVPRVQHHELGRLRPSAVGTDRRGSWAVIDTTGEVWRCDDAGWRRTSQPWPTGTRARVPLDGVPPGRELLATGRELLWLATPGEQSPGRSAGRGHGALIRSLAVSARHGMAFSSASDGSLHAWSVEGPRPTPTTVQIWDSNAGPTGAVFTADGEHLWAPVDGSSCGLLDALTLQTTAIATGMRYPVALTDRGLVGVSAASGLLIVDPENGRARGHLLTSTTALRTAAITPDGRHAAAVDMAGTLLALVGTEARPIAPGFERHYRFILSRAGDRLWTLNSSRELSCYGWPGGDLRWKHTLPALAPDMELSAGEGRLLVAQENSTLEIRSANSGILLERHDTGSAAPQSVVCDHRGSRIFLAGIEGGLHCLEANSTEEIHVLPLGAGMRPHVLSCSPDGQFLACITKTGRLQVVRAR